MKSNPSRQGLLAGPLGRQLKRVLRRLNATERMTPGSLYWMGRKCGKPNCCCARGRLHYTWVVTRSEAGRARLYTVAPKQRQRIRRQTRAYRIYQRNRARLVRLLGRLLRRVDAMAESRLAAWPEKDPRAKLQNPNQRP